MNPVGYQIPVPKSLSVPASVLAHTSDYR
jgi:hypothetical protein